MHPNALKFHEQHTGRPCPYVPLHDDNRDASDITWLGLFERLHFITSDYIRDSLAMERPSKRIRIYRRVIGALQSEAVVRFFNRSYAQAKAASGRSGSGLKNQPQKRAPKPRVRNRFGKSN